MMSRTSLPAERILLLTGLSSFALIAGALGFQYLGGLPPCEMCHWQRWPHIGAALLGLVVAPLWRKNLFGMAAIVIALAAAVGLAAIYEWNMVIGLPPPLLGAVIAILVCAAIGLTGAALWNRDLRLLTMAAITLVLLSGLIGAYQTGMQWHLLPGPSACTAPRYVMGSHAPAPVVRCDVMTWFFLGLALPAWNAILSFAIAAAAAFALTSRA